MLWVDTESLAVTTQKNSLFLDGVNFEFQCANICLQIGQNNLRIAVLSNRIVTSLSYLIHFRLHSLQFCLTFGIIFTGSKKLIMASVHFDSIYSFAEEMMQIQRRSRLNWMLSQTIFIASDRIFFGLATVFWFRSILLTAQIWLWWRLFITIWWRAKKNRIDSIWLILHFINKNDENLFENQNCWRMPVLTIGRGLECSVEMWSCDGPINMHQKISSTCKKLLICVSWDIDQEIIMC